MRTSRTRLTIAVVASILLADRGDAQTQVTPAANMDIYRAGGNAISGGTDPVESALLFDPGDVVRFTNVAGSTDCDAAGGVCFPTGADGNLGADLSVGAVNALSGISYRGNFSMPLVGVFLGASLPGVAPVALDFRGVENFERVDPAPGQIFWIGDGLTGTGFGAVQEFGIPDGATRVVLGFIDPVPGNNNGGLVVTLQVPEATSAALGVTMIATLCALPRRRAREVA